MYGELNLGRETPGYNPTNGRFVKGRKTWNKGMKAKDFIPADKYEEWKEKVVANLKKSLGHWRGKDSPHAKRCVCINKEGKWAIFKSLQYAADMTNLPRSNIKRCCQGKTRHCGGLRWFYETDESWTTEIVII